ncbi:MAG: hypothetical protein IKH27_04115 [Oscillospiraceae bacterium]|nr:hypothetical protein [Oscillospiraceae bacterium]
MKTKKRKILPAILLMLFSIACIIVSTYNIIPIKIADTALTLLGAVLFMLSTVQFFFAVKTKKS